MFTVAPPGVLSGHVTIPKNSENPVSVSSGQRAENIKITREGCHGKTLLNFAFNHHIIIFVYS